MAAINPKNTLEIYYYFDIFLTETYKSLGQLEAITNNQIIGQLTAITFNQNQLQLYDTIPQTNITVSGLTTSRLAEVKSFDPIVPYKVGVNGVILVLDSLIIYEIDGITYQTLLDGSNTTYYSVTKPTNNFDYQNVIRNDDSVFVDLKKTLNAMVINRNNIPVYEYMDKINNCDELADLLDIF
jgi:hypothetical protein